MNHSLCHTLSAYQAFASWLNQTIRLNQNEKFIIEKSS
jgi:hypothetical protein